MFHTADESVFVLSVGGSLIVPPKGIDTDFLKQLNTFIRDYVNKGKKFFLVSGGGSTCRKYQQAARDVIGTVLHEDLDWIGIHSIRLNAQLLRTVFVDIANPRVIENYAHKLENWHEPVVIGAAWKPGASSDHDAVILAQDYGARLIINLTNIDWVYDKDPKKYSNAKKIDHITWGQYRQLVGDAWTPGLNTPFDPIASQLAAQLKLTVIIANGNNFDNLRNIIEGKKFVGSTIEP